MPRKSLWIALIAVTAAACGSQPTEEDYPAKIAAIRAAKDESFKSDSDSPVPADKKATLIPLAYFPIDESLRGPGDARARGGTHAHPGADVDRQTA